MFKGYGLVVVTFVILLVTSVAAFAGPRRPRSHRRHTPHQIAFAVRGAPSIQFLPPSSPDCSSGEPSVPRGRLAAIGFSAFPGRVYSFRLTQTKEDGLASQGGILCTCRMNVSPAPAFWVNNSPSTFYLAITTTARDEGISEVGTMLIDRGVMIDGEPMAVVYEACVTEPRPYQRTCVYRVEQRTNVRRTASNDASLSADGSTDASWPPHTPDGVVDPWDGATAVQLDASVSISSF